MARVTIDGATGGGVGTILCGWQDKCQKHQAEIKYPKGGNMERGSLAGWSHPSTMGLKENATKINDTHTSIKLSGQKVTALNYKFQRHHVIPVEAIKNLPILKNNLDLLGYDINIQAENGISLPFRPKDLVWHDLQFHRGSHPAYTSIVETRIRAIMSKCGQYCEKGEQSTLWDLIKERVDKCRDEIKNWTLFIHPWAVGEKPIQYSAWT